MLEIVKDAFDLSSNIGVTLAEKMRVAKTWSRILIDIIPEERLMDCFEFAFANHHSSFPISAYDLKMTYPQMIELETEQTAEREQALLENDPAFRVANCKNKHEHINAEGEVQILNPANFSEEVIVPCKFCREKAFDVVRARLLEGRQEVSAFEKLGADRLLKLVK